MPKRFSYLRVPYPCTPIAAFLCVLLGTPAFGQTPPAPIDITALIPAIVTAPASPPTTQPARITAPKDSHVYLTEEELAQAFREGQYALVIRETGRLQLAKTVFDTYNKFDVFIFRAESQLRLRDVAAARDTFKQAGEAATNDVCRALTTADLVMIFNQTHLLYTSKTSKKPDPKSRVPLPPVKPIDITDLTQRSLVYLGLYNDALAAQLPVLERAVKSSNMKVIFESSERINVLSDLELAATGATTDGEKLRDLFFNQGMAMLRSDVSTLATALSKIRKEGSATWKVYTETVCNCVLNLPTGTVYDDGTGNLQRKAANRSYQRLSDAADNVAQSAKELSAIYHRTSPALDRLIADANKLSLDAALAMTESQTSASLNPPPRAPSLTPRH